MNNIKAIETLYNGYKFRSRLEARWAVFFDAVGSKWEYEKEGFDLNGTYYLPDFYLPEWSAWVEIKPKVFAEESKGHDNCILLSKVTSPDRVLMISGNPWFGEHSVIACECGVTKRVGVLGETRGLNWDFVGLDLVTPGVDGWYPITTFNSLSLEYAFTQARQARFEHGDTVRVVPFEKTSDSVVQRFIMEAIRSSK